MYHHIQTEFVIHIWWKLWQPVAPLSNSMRKIITKVQGCLLFATYSNFLALILTQIISWRSSLWSVSSPLEIKLFYHNSGWWKSLSYMTTPFRRFWKRLYPAIIGTNPTHPHCHQPPWTQGLDASICVVAAMEFKPAEINPFHRPESVSFHILMLHHCASQEF